MQKKLGASILVFPHASEIFIDDNNFENIESYNNVGDILFCTSNNMKKANEKMLPDMKSIIVGVPSFNNYWKDVCKRMSPLIMPSEETFNILFMTRGPHHTDLSEESFDYIMNSMIDTTMEIQNAKLFIRPHPRYGEKILYKYLNKMSTEKFVVLYDNIYRA